MVVMTNDELRINGQRTFWIDKLHQQAVELTIASLEKDQQQWDKLLVDIETTAIIIWRFDRKLENVRSRKVLPE
jgi:hypothetical protein